MFVLCLSVELNNRKLRGNPALFGEGQLNHYKPWLIFSYLTIYLILAKQNIKLPIKRGEIMVTTLDKFGRVIIPKKFREHLGINLGTALNISEDGARIVLEPVQEKEPVIDKNGILVFTGKLDGKMGDSIRDDRNKRIKKLLLNEV